MNIYANCERLYCYGDVCSPYLFEVAKSSKSLTFNRNFTCGGINGTWKDVPFKEIETRPIEVPPAVQALTTGSLKRTLWNDMSLQLLFAAIKNSIADSWRADAFHVVFASSGFDTRIIQACIWQLMKENGKEWLGEGLLFLSNRWEAARFAQVMQAQGWEQKYFAFYADGADEDHFARGAAGVGRFAPLPIPGNLWYYLPEWAQENSLMPTDKPVQAYTGLWANEAWNCFLSENNQWVGHVRNWYGYNCMASLPVKAQWVEYPLVDVRVLEILAQCVPDNGDIMRQNVAAYACQNEVNVVPRLGLDDRHHKLSAALRERLDRQYKSTWLGRQWGWLCCPTDSDFSTEWGRFSTALLIEELRRGGCNVTF